MKVQRSMSTGDGDDFAAQGSGEAEVAGDPGYGGVVFVHQAFHVHHVLQSLVPGRCRHGVARGVGRAWRCCCGKRIYEPTLQDIGGDSVGEEG